MSCSINRSNQAATPHSPDIDSASFASKKTSEILQELAFCSMTNLKMKLSAQTYVSKHRNTLFG